MAPRELGLGPPVSGLCSSLLVSTPVLPERSGLGEAAATALAAVELHAGVHLHVCLHLVGLSEPARAHGARVRPLSSVDQQVALVVLRRLELLPTLLALVRLDAGVQQLVALQLGWQQEAFVADGADVWPLAAVRAQVVQVEVAQVEGLPAGGAAELLALGVALLVRPQGGAAAEGLQTNLTAEGFGCAAAPPVGGAAYLVLVAVNELLVLLQLTVVEEGLPAEVAHEGLLHTVDQHVGLQSPRSREALAAFITPETGDKRLFRRRPAASAPARPAASAVYKPACRAAQRTEAALPARLQQPGAATGRRWRVCLKLISVPERLLAVVEPQVSLEVVLEAKAEAAGLTHEGLLPRMHHPMLQQTHLTLEGLAALGALEGTLVRVGPLVDAQVAGGGEPLSTGGAGVGPGARVDGLVLPQALLPGEAFSADVTHERFDVSVRHLVVAERADRGEGALAGVTFQRRFLQPVRSLVDAELAQQPELPVTLVTAQQLVGVLLLRLSQLVAQQVLLQRLGLVEALVTGRAGEGFDVTHHVLLQLVPLVETFVTKLAEEPLLLVQLPPPPSLQLLLLLFITG